MTAQLFDPLGWLALVIVRAKILIQSAWIKGLEWNTPLSDEDCRTWQMLYDELPLLEQLRVPRWLARTTRLSNFTDLQMPLSELTQRQFT